MQILSDSQFQHTSYPNQYNKAISTRVDFNQIPRYFKARYKKAGARCPA